MQNTSREAPEFVLYTGCMYSGKTSRAILEAQNHVYRGRQVLAYKPKIDDRFSKTEITTHSGMVSLSAVTVETGKDMIGHLIQIENLEAKNTTVVVDEVFMISGVSDELIWLYRNGFSILVSSLDMSSGLVPFEEVTKIMPWTTRVEKCTAVCNVCKQPAHYTYRKPGADQDEILVGGVETYEARCSICHPLFRIK
jgi:thymidine kinase